MPTFQVTSIIDGDTFEVSPQWKWNGQTGTRGPPYGLQRPGASHQQGTSSEKQTVEAHSWNTG